MKHLLGLCFFIFFTSILMPITTNAGKRSNTNNERDQQTKYSRKDNNESRFYFTSSLEYFQRNYTKQSTLQKGFICKTTFTCAPDISVYKHKKNETTVIVKDFKYDLVPREIEIDFNHEVDFYELVRTQFKGQLAHTLKYLGIINRSENKEEKESPKFIVLEYPGDNYEPLLATSANYQKLLATPNYNTICYDILKASGEINYKTNCHTHKENKTCAYLVNFKTGDFKLIDFSSTMKHGGQQKNFPELHDEVYTSVNADFVRDDMKDSGEYTDKLKPTSSYSSKKAWMSDVDHTHQTCYIQSIVRLFQALLEADKEYSAASLKHF